MSSNQYINLLVSWKEVFMIQFNSANFRTDLKMFSYFKMEDGKLAPYFSIERLKQLFLCLKSV